MSENAAREFLDKVDKDPELQHEVKKIHADYVKLGAIHGHNFSLKELHDELGRRWGVSTPPPYDDPDTCTCI